MRCVSRVHLVCSLSCCLDAATPAAVSSVAAAAAALCAWPLVQQRARSVAPACVAARYCALSRPRCSGALCLAPQHGRVIGQQQGGACCVVHRHRCAAGSCPSVSLGHHAYANQRHTRVLAALCVRVRRVLCLADTPPAMRTLIRTWSPHQQHHFATLFVSLLAELGLPACYAHTASSAS